MNFYKSLMAASAVALLGSAAPSFAQTRADQLKVAYQAARNQLGILMMDCGSAPLAACPE